MGKLEWDKIGERRYETGVDHVVLYKNNGNSAYAWNESQGLLRIHLVLSHQSCGLTIKSI